MRVKEWRGDVVFLHEVAPGAADRSYGIHVARLAGLPQAAVARAEQVLETLETGEQSSAVTRLADDLPLFAAAVERRVAPQPSAVEQRLRATDLDALTPRQALQLLYDLRGLLDGSRRNCTRRTGSRSPQIHDAKSYRLHVRCDVGRRLVCSADATAPAELPSCVNKSRP